MKRNIISLFIILLVTFSYASAQETESTHPVEMQGKDCLYCHADGSTSDMAADPGAHIQWINSLHGLNNVKCVACHGEETTFKPKSNVNKCLACHPASAVINAKVNKPQPDSLVCSSCHNAHSFTPQKNSKKVHKK